MLSQELLDRFDCGSQGLWLLNRTFQPSTLGARRPPAGLPIRELEGIGNRGGFLPWS